MGFSYTNTTASGEKINPTCLGVVTNYAKVQDEPTMARLSNKTASMEQPELITFRSEKIDKVSTAIPVRNPGPSTDGVQYTVKVESVFRTTVGDEVIDEPIAAWMTIKHPASNTWSNEVVASVVNRLVSACLKGQASTGSGTVAAGDWRFEDLMRSALMPSED